METLDYNNLPIGEIEKGLTQKQLKFIEEHEKDNDALQAAIRSGCINGKQSKNSLKKIKKLLRDPKIIAYRKAYSNEVFKNLGLNPDTIALKLNSIFKRCMQAEPYMEWDSELHAYVHKGQFVFDAKNALKALELMGDSMGMFVKKQVNEHHVMSVEEYCKRIDSEKKPDEPTYEY